MKSGENISGVVELGTLAHEHVQIELHYSELDGAILHGQGSPKIVDAAKDLARQLLMHLIHEDQFQKILAFAVLDGQRSDGAKLIADLLQIETKLNRQEVHAALRLRSLCKRWIPEHLYAECDKFEIVAMVEPKEPGRVHFR